MKKIVSMMIICLFGGMVFASDAQQEKQRRIKMCPLSDCQKGILFTNASCLAFSAVKCTENDNYEEKVALSSFGSMCAGCAYACFAKKFHQTFISQDKKTS